MTHKMTLLNVNYLYDRKSANATTGYVNVAFFNLRGSKSCIRCRKSESSKSSQKTIFYPPENKKKSRDKKLHTYSKEVQQGT